MHWEEASSFKQDVKVLGMRVEALLFDMDGLLIDSERIVQKSWELAGRDLGYRNVGQIIYRTLGMNRVRRDLYFKETYGGDFPCDVFAERSSRYFYEIASGGVPVKDGARDLLEYAKSHGYKLAVATSSRRAYAEKVLKDIDIYRYFDGMVTGDMVEHSKPDPEVYLKASALVNTEPDRCIALEDAPAGIRAAHAAGTIPVLIPDLLEPPVEIAELAFRKYKSLREVIPLLESLGQN